MSRLTNVAAAYILISATSATSVIDRILYGEWEGKSGDKLTQVMNLVLIIASLFLLYKGWRKTGAPRLKQLIPFAGMAFIMASAIWSFEPIDTERRAVTYLITVVGAFGMAQALPPLQIMKLTVWVCVVAALASLALLPTSLGVVFNPDTGTVDFRGVFSYKNMLGEAMVAGVLAALYCLSADGRARTRYTLVTAFLVLVIVAAKSATSLIISGLYVLMLTVFILHAKGGAARILSFCALALGGLAAVLLAAHPDFALEALGKDPTLTGRTDLWPYVIDRIADKPLLGWGFNGFWLPSNLAAIEISSSVGWYVVEAHNGLLEFLIELGVIGTAIFVWLMARNVGLAVKCLRWGNRDLGISTLLFLVGLLFMAVSEAILLSPGQIPTLQFFLLGFMCENDLRGALARRRTAPFPRGARPAVRGNQPQPARPLAPCGDSITDNFRVIYRKDLRVAAPQEIQEPRRRDLAPNFHPTGK